MEAKSYPRKKHSSLRRSKLGHYRCGCGRLWHAVAGCGCVCSFGYGCGCYYGCVAVAMVVVMAVAGAVTK